ncbi:MAG: response regulator [Desulfobacteraceae bacterium]
MEQHKIHAVLVVDDEENIGKAVTRILKKYGIRTVFAPSGEAALAEIQNTDSPFPVIISDQRMPGMKGYEFLEKSIDLLPGSIRILMSGYSDLDAVIESVNKGRIHRFIPKPWKNEELVNAVREGIEQHELVFENQRLLRTAKEQNKKLHEVAQEFRRKTGRHKKTISQLNREIETLEKKIESLEHTPERIRETGLKEVENLLFEKDLLTFDGIGRVYQSTLDELYEQLSDTARRSGFSLPGSPGEGSS